MSGRVIKAWFGGALVVTLVMGLAACKDVQPEAMRLHLVDPDRVNNPWCG